MPTSWPQLAERLPQPPTPISGQPETFSSIMSSRTTSSEKTEQSPELLTQPKSSSFEMTVLPTPSYFDIAHSNESRQQSTDASSTILPTVTVLPTPSYYDCSGSNPNQEQERNSAIGRL